MVFWGVIGKYFVFFKRRTFATEGQTSQTDVAIVIIEIVPPFRSLAKRKKEKRSAIKILFAREDRITKSTWR